MIWDIGWMDHPEVSGKGGRPTEDRLFSSPANEQSLNIAAARSAFQQIL